MLSSSLLNLLVYLFYSHNLALTYRLPFLPPCYQLLYLIFTLPTLLRSPRLCRTTSPGNNLVVLHYLTMDNYYFTKFCSRNIVSACTQANMPHQYTYFCAWHVAWGWVKDLNLTVHYLVGDMIMLTCSAYRSWGIGARTTYSEDKREHSWGSTDKIILFVSLSWVYFFSLLYMRSYQTIASLPRRRTN